MTANVRHIEAPYVSIFHSGQLCVVVVVGGIFQLDTTELDFTNPSFPQSRPPPFKQKLWQT